MKKLFIIAALFCAANLNALRFTGSFDKIDVFSPDKENYLDTLTKLRPEIDSKKLPIFIKAYTYEGPIKGFSTPFQIEVEDTDAEECEITDTGHLMCDDDFVVGITDAQPTGVK